MLFLTFESFKCTFHLIDLLKITIYPNSFLIIIYIYNIPKSISLKRQQFNNAIRYLDKENREPLQPTLIHENFKIPLPDELTSILIKRNRRPS